jgi:hypothetical protein
MPGEIDHVAQALPDAKIETGLDDVIERRDDLFASFEI